MPEKMKCLIIDIFKLINCLLSLRYLPSALSFVILCFVISLPKFAKAELDCGGPMGLQLAVSDDGVQAGALLSLES